jgi:hypothetical protein
MFKVNKPTNWARMRLCDKIKYYKGVITKDYAPYVDKIEAKSIVSAMTDGRVKCATLIRILSDPDDFHESDINTNHIIKSAHGCGWNISIEKATTVDRVVRTLKPWNRHYTGSNEPHYMFIKPRFFIEEKINDIVLGQTGNANVYLIRCIHGKPFVIGVRTKSGQNSYDLNWNPVKKLEIQGLEKPAQLPQMLEYAALLSAPFEFVRIDFYIGSDGNIYFSEFTFTPSGGSPFYSPAIETQFGALWT